MKHLLMVLSFAIGAYANPILDSFETLGYYELLNETLGSTSFDLLYEEYDHYIDQTNSNSAWSNAINSINREYSNLLALQIHSVPLIGYRSERYTPGLASLFYSEDYHQFLINHPRYPEIASKELEAFLDHFNILWKTLYQKAELLVEQIAETHPNIKNILYTQDHKLLFQIKALKYTPCKPKLIPAHFDFTGLTFLVDNNEGSRESLLLSPFHIPLIPSDFLPPKRCIPRLQDSSSLLVIPGAFLKYCQLPINPTAHLILKTPHIRYSTVAFILLPKHNALYYDNKTLPHVPQVSEYQYP